jgi:hypothetical protein
MEVNGIVERGWNEGNFSYKTYCKWILFVGIPNDYNPMNQTTFIGKKSYG